MNTIPAYPLQWPAGWRRIHSSDRNTARFGKASIRGNGKYQPSRSLTIAEASERLCGELTRMGIRKDDLVISTNLLLRLDGFPRSGQVEPADPGAAVYWRDRGETRCMAVDRYDRVADNIAAIAATLEAMRAIERHGGAAILDRAFSGFKALPGRRPWYDTLGVPENADHSNVEAAYRRLRSLHHPDRHGDPAAFHDVQVAYDEYLALRA